MHEMTKNNNRASMHSYVSCIGNVCLKNYILMLKNHENSLVNCKLRRNFGIRASLKALSILINTVVEVSEIETF